MDDVGEPGNEQDDLEKRPTMSLDVSGGRPAAGSPVAGEDRFERLPTVALEIGEDGAGRLLPAPGTVVAAGDDGRYVPATLVTAEAVIGVVTARGAGAGSTVLVGESKGGLVAVTVLGVAKARATDASGPIRAGDMLTVGPTPGTAARTDHPDRRTVLGKALDELAGAEGEVHVLLMHT